MIKNGLAESNVTLLEQYLRKLFEIFDEEKTGKISAQNMMEALTKAEKITLTQIQLYILRNFVKKDADNNIDYLKESKFLAEMIKKFFCPSVLKKQVLSEFNKISLNLIGPIHRKRNCSSGHLYGRLDH